MCLSHTSKLWRLEHFIIGDVGIAVLWRHCFHFETHLRLMHIFFLLSFGLKVVLEVCIAKLNSWWIVRLHNFLSRCTSDRKKIVTCCTVWSICDWLRSVFKNHWACVYDLSQLVPGASLWVQGPVRFIGVHRSYYWLRQMSSMTWMRENLSCLLLLDLRYNALNLKHSDSLQRNLEVRHVSQRFKILLTSLLNPALFYIQLCF